jgi:hypothetical protein
MTTCVVAVSKPDAASLVRDVASPAAHFNWNHRGFGCNQQYPKRTRATTRAIHNTRPTNFLIMMRSGPSFGGAPLVLQVERDNRLLYVPLESAKD